MSGFAETLLYLNEWKFKIWGAPAAALAAALKAAEGAKRQ